MQVTNHNRVWIPVALFLLTFLIYAVSLPNQFLWDDEEAIVQNQLIHSLANLPKLCITFGRSSGRFAVHLSAFRHCKPG